MVNTFWESLSFIKLPYQGADADADADAGEDADERVIGIPLPIIQIVELKSIIFK